MRGAGGFALANWRLADTVPWNAREQEATKTGARFRLWNARDERTRLIRGSQALASQRDN